MPAGKAPPREARSHELLQALSGALAILGSARDEREALVESFDHAARAFGAEKALLLRVRSGDASALESLRAAGLDERQVEACVSGQPLEGVSPSRIRQAIETGRPQLVENSQFENKGAAETGSLAARPYSVLATPVSDPWTRSVLAVLYFQTAPGPTGYSEEDLPFLEAYATALGHAFGLFLGGERRLRQAEEEWKRRDQAPEIVGDSEATHRLRRELLEIYVPASEAQPPRPILVLGETGTGKDLVARYLHYYSPARSRGPFVEHNCASLSGELVQSVLFGHVKGAFTGAQEAALGLVRAAHKGTLFLDEIGELPARGQELLLKVLDHWQVQPLGDTRGHPVDVQLVLATNRELAQDAAAGRFRQDLFQRLKALTLRLAPLRDRPGDIRPLVAHFLAQAEKSLKRRTRGLSPDALRALLAYRWPGNVREVAGCCAALVLHAQPGEELSRALLERVCPEVLSGALAAGRRFAQDSLAGSFQEAHGRFERQFLLDRLELLGWDVPETARSLGLSAATLYRYLQRHGLREGR